MAPEPNQRIGPYEIVRSLGKGGMGEVLLARDPALDRQVAIKRIRAGADLEQTSLDRFRREARMAAKLGHSVIVAVYHLLQSEGADHIVMEYVAGPTLRDRLGAGPLPIDEGLRIARTIVEGLSYAHRQGVLHRDLKTENILLGPDGQVKIADFGLARPIAEDDAPLTRTGLVMGTTRAMSPEQACGDLVDERSDLFSLGVLFYEVFTGTSPFEAANNAQTLKRVVFDRHTRASDLIPELPPDLVDLIDQLLEKEPDARPDGADLVLQRLYELGGRVSTSDETTVSPVPTSSTGATPRAAGRTATAATTANRTRGERRQVTVLACDLVSVGDEPGHSLDPERLFEVMPDFQELARAIVDRYEGHLSSVLGHRLLITFGYPESHEDEGRRAVHAALELVARSAELERGGDTERLAMRIGIHTGPAVAIDGAAPGDELVLGPTLDLATRLQQFADLDTIMVSETTRRTLEGFFITEEVASGDSPSSTGTLGFAVHRVVRARGAFSRVETSDTLSPLIGRERELDLLLDRWRSARGGQGQVVAIGGEAGFGKSRLMHTLRERLREDGAQLVLTHGSSFTGNTPLAPVSELLRSILGIQADATRAERRELLELGLQRLGLDSGDLGPDLAPLLGIDWQTADGDDDARLELGAEARRRRTFDSLLSLIGELAARRPLVLMIEDLHWVDPTTLELLGVLIEQIEGAALLLVLTFRPEFDDPWKQPHVTRIHLGRLQEPEAEALLDLLAGGSLPPAIRRKILERSDGVPLYLEELTRAMLDDSSTGVHHVPATLQASLLARLDRLRGGKDVAQLAAVCGRELTFDLLHAASPLPEIDLSRHLDRLCDAGILQRRGLGRTVRYAFRHALVQDAALETLLASRRRALHLEVARALEEKFPEVEVERPERLGRHYEEGQSYERAAELFDRAGDRSRDAFAIAEALSFYQRAERLTERALVRRPREARLLATIAELAERRGDLHTQVARYDDARTAYRTALERAEIETPRRTRLERKIGAAFGLEHRRDEALEALDRAAQLLPPTDVRTAADHEEAIQIEIERLNVHYFQGELDPMETIGRRLAPTIARWGSPRQRAALHSSLLARSLRRDRFHVDDETLAHAEAAHEAAQEIGNAEGVADARFNVAFADLLRGNLERATSGFQDTLELSRRIEARLIETAARSYLALAARRRGEVDATADAALALVDERDVGALYAGLAHALLAWVAWRRGDHPEVDRQGREAMATWNRASSAFPFQWTALLPLIAAGVEREAGVDDEILGWCERLVDSTQQRLPELEAAVEEVRQAATIGAPRQTERAIADLVAAARRQTLL
ncbi:MAG: protein kinase [Acidobacteriota bacterium]